MPSIPAASRHCGPQRYVWDFLHFVTDRRQEWEQLDPPAESNFGKEMMVRVIRALMVRNTSGGNAGGGAAAGIGGDIVEEPLSAMLKWGMGLIGTSIDVLWAAGNKCNPEELVSCVCRITLHMSDDLNVSVGTCDAMTLGTKRLAENVS